MEINNKINNIQSTILDKKSYESYKVSKLPNKLESHKQDNKKETVEVKELKEEDIKSKIKQVNESLNDQGLVLSYLQEEKSGKMIIQLKDSKTNEVIKQIPTKEMLQIADNISNYLKSYNKTGVVEQTTSKLLISDKV